MKRAYKMKNLKKIFLLSSFGLLAYAPYATAQQEPNIDNAINTAIIQKLSSIQKADVNALLAALNDVKNNTAGQHAAWSKLSGNLNTSNLLGNLPHLKAILKQISPEARAAVLDKIPEKFHCFVK